MDRNTALTLTTISLIIGFGYVYFMISGRATLNPLKQRYIKLFEKEYFIKHLIICSILAIIGLLRFTANTHETFYFLPIIFLIGLKLANSIIKLLFGRNIIIATRWDNPPEGKNEINFLDSLFIWLILTIGFGFCIMVKKSQFSKNYNNQNKQTEIINKTAANSGFKKLGF